MTCSAIIDEKNVEIYFKIKTCGAKPSITIGMKVDALYVDWNGTFENSVDFAIPGFARLGYVYVYLNLTMEDKSSGDIYLKVCKYQFYRDRKNNIDVQQLEHTLHYPGNRKMNVMISLPYLS